jgi:hypothetical protein
MPHPAIGGHHGGSPYPFPNDLSSMGLRHAAWFDVRKVCRLREPRGRARFLRDDARQRLLDVCKTGKNTALDAKKLAALRREWGRTQQEFSQA